MSIQPIQPDPLEPLPPTQVRHPWRATARTVFAALVAFSAMWPLIVEALDLPPDWRLVAVVTAATGVVTRLLAVPAVEEFLSKFLPFLAATPKDNT